MQIGDFRLEIVPDTEFWLDGGAMFGVVPRVLWEQVSEPDSLNRIRLNMNCTFLDNGNDRILIETGIGEKWSERQEFMYGIDRKRPFAESLRLLTGCGPEDITFVINTHLHFDHAGGNTIGDESRPQFPNARYLVSHSEIEKAEAPHEREAASYLPENWRPIQRSGQLELIGDDHEVVPGLKLHLERGHSETMQTWSLNSGGKTVYGFADLIPMRAHLNPAWVMGYDLLPAETLAFKKRVLPKAVAEEWICVLYHDPDTPICSIGVENERFFPIDLN